jgi:hypothetical protein
MASLKSGLILMIRNSFENPSWEIAYVGLPTFHQNRVTNTNYDIVRPS